MLNFWGANRRFCDRINRRDFLSIGALGLGGLTLADVLRLRAEAGTGTKPRAVIMVCLAGGPSHIDMYDLKPNAPLQCRGEFKPIKTNVPGFDICEHMPLQATIADKLSLVRTVKFIEPMGHELEEVYTGFPKSAGRPSFGAVVSRFRGSKPQMPAYVSLEYGEHTTSYESPQYVGAAHRPLQLVGNEGVRNLSLPVGMPRSRLEDRQTLLKSFDTLRRDLDTRREIQAMDTHSARALEIITSAKAREAFDLTRESDKVLSRYIVNDDTYSAGAIPKYPWYGSKLLLARRLVEAGVSVVTLRMGGWDHHGSALEPAGTNIFRELRSVLPMLDRSIYALVTDLHERGLDKEVLVLVWGEFGRTPKVDHGGRDHWPDAGFALFSGGGLRMGQVVGETDSKAELPRNRAVGAQNVLGTVYHALGIDPTITLPDFSGRPTQLLDDGKAIEELVS